MCFVVVIIMVLVFYQIGLSSVYPFTLSQHNWLAQTPLRSKYIQHINLYECTPEMHSRWLLLRFSSVEGESDQNAAWLIRYMFNRRINTINTKTINVRENRNSLNWCKLTQRQEQSPSLIPGTDRVDVFSTISARRMEHILFFQNK
jgi:hypothetical protein